MRIHGLPEVTELQENDSFVVDSPSAGTRSLPKEKAKEIFGGGTGFKGTGFKRIFQASAVLTASDTIEITLPLRLTGIDSADGPEDQSEESEYLLPGDVFFVSVDTGGVVSNSRIERSIFRSSVDDWTFDSRKATPYSINSGIQISSASGEGMYGNRSVGLYLRSGSTMDASSYLKRGKKLFFIMLYNGWVTANHMPSFTDLTDGYIGAEIMNSHSNSLIKHCFSFARNINTSSDLNLINVLNNVLYPGSFLMFIYEHGWDINKKIKGALKYIGVWIFIQTANSTSLSLTFATPSTSSFSYANNVILKISEKGNNHINTTIKSSGWLTMNSTDTGYVQDVYVYQTQFRG